MRKLKSSDVLVTQETFNTAIKNLLTAKRLIQIPTNSNIEIGDALVYNGVFYKSLVNITGGVSSIEESDTRFYRAVIGSGHFDIDLLKKKLMNG